MRVPLVAFAVVALCGVASAVPSEDLDQARKAFRAGKLDLALPLFNALLYPQEQLANREELTDAYIALGVCRFAAGDVPGAKREFEKALSYDRDRQMDPSAVNMPDAIKLFEETKRELATREFAEAAAEQHARDLANTVIVQAHPYALNFVPGGGQLERHAYLKASLIVGGEVATAAISAGIWGILVNRYGLTNTHVPLADGAHVRLLQQVEIGTGIGFFAIWGYSIVDALVYYRAETKRRATDSDLPAAPAPKKKTSFHVVPMLAPNSAGIGIAWEN